MAIGKVERQIFPASMPISSKEERLMKVGLFVNTQFPEGFNVTERIPEMNAQVHAAREAGFASRDWATNRAASTFFPNLSRVRSERVNSS